MVVVVMEVGTATVTAHLVATAAAVAGHLVAVVNAASAAAGPQLTGATAGAAAEHHHAGTAHLGEWMQVWQPIVQQLLQLKTEGHLHDLVPGTCTCIARQHKVTYWISSLPKHV